MTLWRREVILAIEVAAFVVAVGAIDFAFWRPGLSVPASLALFGGEVAAGAAAWVAASLLLEGRMRWGVGVALNEGRYAVRTVVGGWVFFALLAAAVLAFGWRSMSLVPILATGFLVWWLIDGLASERRKEESKRAGGGEGSREDVRDRPG